MRFMRTVALVAATAAMALLLVGAGFMVCTLPPVTTMLARGCSDDVTSPFSREQLVRVAEATRDYSFGAHDQQSLYTTMYEVNLELRDDLAEEHIAIPSGLPRLDVVEDPSDTEQVKRVLSSASEAFVLTEDAVSHLDDCNAIARVAYPLIGTLAVLVAVACVWGWRQGHRRDVGTVVRAAGLTVLLALTALGIFAAIDFNQFFTLFHGVLFSQGNWQFSYDSLLICALPTAFWMGMGAVWLTTSVVASCACVIAGRRLRRHPVVPRERQVD